MKLIENQALRQFIKFGIVGVSNTLISLGVYWIVLWFNADWYLFGNLLGWFVSVANAFYWNNKYVFRGDDSGFGKCVKRIAKTYLCYGGTFLLSTVLLYYEVDILNWSAEISPVLNLLVTIPLNFLLNKFWTFR